MQSFEFFLHCLQFLGVASRTISPEVSVYIPFFGSQVNISLNENFKVVKKKIVLQLALLRSSRSKCELFADL